MTKKVPMRGLPSMHPGELFREEILPALDRPKTEIARLLGVSRQTLYEILEEKQPVTPMMALRLGPMDRDRRGPRKPRHQGAAQREGGVTFSDQPDDLRRSAVH
jgi:addiction module HigA family antidote